MNRPFNSEAVIARMAETRPQVIELAEIVALAASVDRRLLRKARRTLTSAGPEAEADLYFSELVLDRNPARLVFRPEAAIALRRRLAARPSELERAWALVSARHDTLPATLRTEELLQWHALRGETDAVRDLLRTCVSTLVEQGRQGFAAWAIDAVARMDPLVREHEEYRMLGLGAAMRTGARPQQLAELADERLAEWLEWLAPDSGERTELGFTLVEGGIEFGPAGDPRYSQRISLPGRFPQMLDIREAGGKSHALNLRSAAPTVLETASSDLVITAEDGTRLRVRPPGQRFVNANRTPRVHISYDVETYGARKSIELPFVIGVLGDFAGPAGKRPPLEERHFREIDIDSFDRVMAQIAPSVLIAVPNEIAAYGMLECDLRFETMADFSPDAIVRKMPQTNELLQARRALNDLLVAMDGKEEAAELVHRTLEDVWLVQRIGLNAPARFGRPHDQQRREARKLFLEGQIFRARLVIESFLPSNPESSLASDESFLTMLKRSKRKEFAGRVLPDPFGLTRKLRELTESIPQAFRPRSPERQDHIERAIVDLCAILADYPQLNFGEPIKTIESVIDWLDALIGKQVNHILADPGFRKLESTWRGLHYLVSQTETGKDLKIKIFDVADSELLEASQCHEPLSPAGARGPLYRTIYETEFGQLGGEPFTAILCDFAFGDKFGDLAILTMLGTIGEMARTTFIASAAPSALGFESWAELSNPRMLDPDRLTFSADNETTQAFRSEDASRHIVLTMPGVYGRARYSNRDNPVESFAFDEVDPPPLMSAGWALGVCIARACATYGWPSRIRGVEGGGTVSGLPLAIFRGSEDDDLAAATTEVTVSDRREAELAELGLIPLLARKNTDEAVFIGSQTLHRPAKDADEGQRAQNILGSRLPYQLVHARFAHYLMCMTRDWVGGRREPHQIQADLQNWLYQYVSADPDTAGEDHRARLPLKAAKVSVQPSADPGYFEARLDIIPHYQLEGLDVTIPGRFWLPAGS